MTGPAVSMSSSTIAQPTRAGSMGAPRNETLLVGTREVLLRDLYRTPRWLFTILDRKWGFALDAAARSDDALCGQWLGPDHADMARRDALECDLELWTSAGGPVFCNPPYSIAGGPLMRWATRFRDASAVVPVVALVPCTPSTQWFRLAYDTAKAIDFLEGRLAYDQHDGEPSDGARGDSAIITWEPRGPAVVSYFRLLPVVPSVDG